MNPQIKAQAEYIFAQLGISASAAIKMFFNQVAVTGKIPFSPTTVDENGFSPHMQNKITTALLEKEEETFSSMGSMIADLKKISKK